MENNYNNIIVKKIKDAIKFKKLPNIYCPKVKSKIVKTKNY